MRPLSLLLAASLLAGCSNAPEKPSSPADTGAVDTAPPDDTAPDDTAPVDADGDGYPADVDCNDHAALVFPGAVERCNGQDDNCEGSTDEGAVDARTLYADKDGDGHGDLAVEHRACAPGSGWVLDGDDCDDADALVFPGAKEVCGDEVDQDCSGDDEVCPDPAPDDPTPGESAPGEGAP